MKFMLFVRLMGLTVLFVTPTLYASTLNHDKTYQLAIQGNADAQAELAMMYRSGINTNKDNLKAFQWYKKAAEQGQAIAQNNLAVMYATGEGVKQDYEQSFQWYGMAASQELPDVRTGKGGSRDQ